MSGRGSCVGRVGLTAWIVYASCAAAPRPDALPLQVALDRAGFSVGEIDGRFGAKTLKALHALQQARGLSVSDAPDEATWTALAESSAGPQTHGPIPPTVTYTVTEEDTAGPFIEKIPRDAMAQAKLEQLAYRSIVEMLAERFHVSPALLRRLNANVRGPYKAGTTLTVPNVEPLVPPQGKGRRKDADAITSTAASTNGHTNGHARANGQTRTPTPAPLQAQTQALAVEVIVSKEHNDLAALDANGAVIFYAPVSSGSAHDPLPIGDWTIRGVYLNPTFFYNPDLFWDAEPKHTRARIAAGPNNPVGFVWIDLDRPHYGLHGTPEPASVGITQSHGCVRLTNWDAVRLAALVREGTRVSFRP
jgi:lipoprotein-anchoring transpeptidase ErfK/SrfK